METKIVTLPMKAYKKEKIGLLVIPLFSEILRSKTGFKTTLALNLSDSFEQRYEYIDNYYELIKDTNINLDNVWMDTKNKEKLLKEIDKLVQLEAIKEKTKNIKRCKCGKVEIDENISKEITGKCYKNINGELYCNSCKEIAESRIEKCLVFETMKDFDVNISAYPRGISKQLKEINKKIIGNDIIISRNRDTGYEYEFNGNTYNIDVDFIWQNYLSTIDDNCEKIVIGSNHTIFPMYMINMLERYKGNNNVSFIALPHVEGLDNIDFKNLDMDSKKMTINFLTSKMKLPSNNWNPQLYNYIEKMHKKQKDKFKEILYEHTPVNEGEGTMQYINRIITNELNFQKVLKKSKTLDVIEER